MYDKNESTADRQLDQILKSIAHVLRGDDRFEDFDHVCDVDEFNGVITVETETEDGEVNRFQITVEGI